MRGLLILGMLVTATAATAQPGAPMAPSPEPGSASPPMVPAAYAYQPAQVTLTADDQALLARGEIDQGRHLAGGAVAFFFGYGTGHMVQGRWAERGWMFTLGEGLSTAVAVYGLFQFVNAFACEPNSSCDAEARGGFGLMLAGMVAGAGFRIWQTVDALTVPPQQNARIRELRLRMGYPPPAPYYGLYLSPPQSRDGGGVAGLSLRF